MRRFVDAAGGASAARILVITWASSQPERIFAVWAEELAPFIERSRLEEAERAPLADRARFLAQLVRSTALFFTGGDQSRIMQVLSSDPEVAQTIRTLYRRGIPIGGTSAGAAVLSSLMFTGREDPAVIDPAATGLAEGFGLVSNVLFDTHFLRRQRENRLFGAVLGNPSFLGVGIDENTALWIKDDRLAEVMGPTQVMVVRVEGARLFQVRLYLAGETFDLRH